MSASAWPNWPARLGLEDAAVAVAVSSSSTVGRSATTAISSSWITSGGGTRTAALRGTMVGCGLALPAAGANAAGFTAVAGLASGLIAVWASAVVAATRVAPPSRTTGTMRFMWRLCCTRYEATRGQPASEPLYCSPTEDPINLHQERAAAVQHLVDEARRIEQNGVNHATLEKIGGLLSSLASRAELFPQDEFPLGADGGIYRLSEDPDHRFALYASAGGSAKKVPPHNHTTWAIIAGVARRRTQRRLRAPRQRRAGRRCEAARGAGQGEDAAPRRFHLLPARRLPPHRDAARRRRCAASSLLWPQPRAPARSRVGRHGDGGGQALHGQGEDPDAAAFGPAGQGDAEVGRGVRLLRRARGGRVLDPGPSAVRHAAAAVAPRAARARPAARSPHADRADGWRRGGSRSAMERPGQPRRRQALGGWATPISPS